MGKFDSFSGGKASGLPIAVKSGTGALATAETNRQARYLAKASEAKAQGRTTPGTGSAAFAVALDATGSMARLIDGTRRHIGTILGRIYEEARARVSVRVYVYRDYDVPKIVCESSPLSGESKDLEAWLAAVRVDGGGSNRGEAVETALEAIYNAAEANAVLLAGDEPSNPRNDLDARGHQNTPTAHDWARRFGEKNVPIHTFAVGDRPVTIKDFQEISRLSGGQAGRLDGSSAMIDMAVMAMLAQVRGAASVSRYMERYALTDQSRKFGALLLSAPK